MPVIHEAPQHYETVVLGEKDLIFSTYDPTLGGINCQGDCRYSSQGYYVWDWYQRGAACPEGWEGRIIEIPGGHRFKCIDRGGMIVETDDAIIIDVLIHHEMVDDFPYDGGARLFAGTWEYSVPNYLHE